MTTFLETLVDAVVGGATAAAKGIATDAVRSAYGAIKERLSLLLTVWPQIESRPDSPAYRQVAKEELTPHVPFLAEDTGFREHLRALQDALTVLDVDTAQAAGIDIARIRSGRDVVLNDLQAEGPISVKEILAEQDVRIEGLRARSTEKNG